MNDLDRAKETARAALRELQMERAVNAVMPAPCMSQRVLPLLNRRYFKSIGHLL